ncbi:MAG: hypothetical protein ABI411_04935 [Tahibacter sp.]
MQSRHVAFMLMHAIAASSACAQAPDRVERRPPPPAEVARQLGLDANQTPQFIQILEEQRGRMRALREANEADRAVAHANREALREQTQTRLRALLTADQLARFDAMRPPPPPPGPEPPEHDGRPPGAR